MRVSMATLKQGLVFFWAIWFTVVFATNLFDLLKQFAVLPENWAFASGNYDFMLATTARYTLPDALVLLLFVGVVVWEGLAALLLWRAWLVVRSAGDAALPVVTTAFAVCLALWAAFMLADELLLAFDVEATHMRIFTAQTATLLALHLLPNGARAH